MAITSCPASGSMQRTANRRAFASPSTRQPSRITKRPPQGASRMAPSVADAQSAQQPASTDGQQGRRQLLLGATAAAPALLLLQHAPAWAVEAVAVAAGPAGGSAVQLQRYTDPLERFSLQVPAGWEQVEGQLPGNNSFSGATGGRRTIAWFPAQGASDVNVSITITNTSFEFTSMGSFGNVYTFGNNLVASMDRSQLLRAPAWVRERSGPVQVAKLLDAKEVRGGQYFVEYTVQKLPDPARHLASVAALSNNGTYNRLFTVTAQCLDGDQLATYGPLLQQIVDSFVPPAAKA